MNSQEIFNQHNSKLSAEFAEMIYKRPEQNGWKVVLFEDKFARYFYLNGRVTARLFYPTLEDALKIN